MNPARRALLWASESSWLERHAARLWFVRTGLRRFMPGEELDDAMAAARALATHGIGAVITLLGEHVGDEAAAGRATAEYLGALGRLAVEATDVELSVKLSQLGLEVGTGVASANLEAIVRSAGELGIYVWVDMESSRWVDSTLDAYRGIRHRHANVGICLQANLLRTPADAEALMVLRPGLRLVKGAYREPAGVAHQRRRAVDAAFASLARWMLGRTTEATRMALATHDVELLEAIERDAASDPAGHEVQMLYGIRVEDQLRLAADGHRVRVLIGYGTSWFPWYVRRLAERPANVGFVLRNVFRRPAPTRRPAPAAP